MAPSTVDEHAIREPLLGTIPSQPQPEPREGNDKLDNGGSFARNLGTTEAFAIIISIVIGSGIFTSPGSVDANVPAPAVALAVWLVGGVLAWTGACTLAELGTSIKGEGGVQPYLQHAFGEVFGFLAAWTWIISVMPATLAILSIVFVESIFSVASADPERAGSVAHKLLSILVLAATGLANCIGTDASTRLNKVFVSVKFVAIIAVVTAGVAVAVVSTSSHGEENIGGGDWRTKSWFGMRDSINPDGTKTEWSKLGTWEILGHCCTALYGALWGYSGWDKAIYISAELSAPARQLPLAFNTAIPVIILCFITANASYYILLPWDVVSTTDSIAVTAITRLLGPAFGIAAAVLICMVVAGSLLGNSFVAGRMTVAAAHKQWLPHPFGLLGHVGLSPRQHIAADAPKQPGEEPTTTQEQQQESEAKQGSDAPLNAIILSTILSSLYILFGNFRALLVFNGLGEYSFFFLTTIGAMVLRFTEPHLMRPYKTFLVIPIIFALVSGFVVIRGASFEPTIAMVLVFLWFIGVGFYYLGKQ